LFGINALDGLADVDVELDLDTYAELDLTLSESYQSGFTGCADVKTGIAVSAAANGSFFSLFNKASIITVYNKSFDLFKVSHLWPTFVTDILRLLFPEMLRQRSPP
jgi:hypothetical protein